MSYFYLKIASLLSILLFSNVVLATSMNVFGTFLTEEKNARVEITDCRDGATCGVVVWLDAEKLP